jgi:hypothetical protein
MLGRLALSGSRGMEIPGGVLLKANVSAVRRKGEFEKAGKLAGKAADRLARARLVSSGGRRASGFVHLQSMSGPGALPSVRLYGKDPWDRRGRPPLFPSAKRKSRRIRPQTVRVAGSLPWPASVSVGRKTPTKTKTSRPIGGTFFFGIEPFPDPRPIFTRRRKCRGSGSRTAPRQ